MVGRTKRASFKGIHGSLVGYKSCPDPELAGLEYIFALVMDQTIKDYIAARKIRYQYEFGDEKDQIRLQRKKETADSVYYEIKTFFHSDYFRDLYEADGAKLWRYIEDTPAWTLERNFGKRCTLAYL